MPAGTGRTRYWRVMPVLIAVAALGAMGAASPAAASTAAMKQAPAIAYVANDSSVLPIDTTAKTVRPLVKVGSVRQFLPAPDGRVVYRSTKAASRLSRPRQARRGG
jgi:uncharacterized protein YcfJ